MDILGKLPAELLPKIFLYMQHPIAEVFQKAIEKDKKFLIKVFQKAYPHFPKYPIWDREWYNMWRKSRGIIIIDFSIIG